MAKEPYAFQVRWQKAKRTRESKIKKVGGRLEEYHLKGLS
jgi:hypothetical protein